MKRPLTNERAIKLINKKFGGKSKYEATALIFASEDIIDMDVQEWLNTPLHELYDSFIYNSVEGVHTLIDNAIEEDEYYDEKDLAYGAISKMVAVMKAMSAYADIYQTLQQESER